MASIHWSDEVDDIIGGDLTAALAYVTPAGWAVVTAVAPIGMRDHQAGTVTFTTSLGFGKKLERIKRDPRVALAYHSRQHGFSKRPGFVLVQGRAVPIPDPDPDLLEDVIGVQAERFMGAPKRGRLFWDRWLREYYKDRVPVTIEVERVVAWPGEQASGQPTVWGTPLPGDPPEQVRPAKGTGPRVNAERAERRLRGLHYRLLALTGADGFPDVAPVDVTGSAREGIQLASRRRLPPGGRRAGLLGHSYRSRLIGLESRTHTGWLTVPEQGDALYAPHTYTGFRAPSNKTLLLLANGFLAKRGLRKARRRGAAA
jgi:hypothetical protein